MSGDEQAGYDPEFLPIGVALPHPVVDRSTLDLTYPHFTVVFQPSRRLAAATGVNIDGGELLDLARGDDWHYDPRIPEAQQAGPDIYARNDLDRGHLVRRRDPVWGAADVAAAANEATFAFTNAAPQAAPFNQGPELWVGLEDHVLQYAAANGQRISVFTGPVLADDDPLYRGLRVPRLFWKIAAWATAASADAHPLRAAGFVLDQSAQLDAILARERSGLVPPLGPYLTFQVPVVDIGELTGLDVGQLAEADVMGRPHERSAAEPRDRWAWLESADDIVL